MEEARVQDQRDVPTRVEDQRHAPACGRFSNLRNMFYNKCFLLLLIVLLTMVNTVINYINTGKLVTISQEELIQLVKLTSPVVMALSGRGQNSANYNSVNSRGFGNVSIIDAYMELRNYTNL